MTDTLTFIELKAIAGIMNSDFHDGRGPVGSPVWSWSCNPFPDKRVFAGAVSSLVKKGLVLAEGSGLSACLTLTSTGWDAYEFATRPGSPTTK
jgi:hypothetical protein